MRSTIHGGFRPAALAMFLAFSSPAAASHPDIESARALISQARLVQALPLLDRAERSPELTEEDLLAVHWLRVVVHQGMGKAEKAQASMDAVLALRPMFEPDPLSTPPDLRAAFQARAVDWQKHNGATLSVRSLKGAHVVVDVTSAGAVPSRVMVFARPAGSVRYEKFEADVVGGAADVTLKNEDLWKAAGAAKKFELVLEARRRDGVAISRTGDALKPITQLVTATQVDAAVKEIAPPPEPPPAPVAVKPAEPKPAETKPVEAKPAEPKPVGAKPAEPKPADSKPADSKRDPQTMVLVVPPQVQPAPVPPPQAPQVLAPQQPVQPYVPQEPQGPYVVRRPANLPADAAAQPQGTPGQGKPPAPPVEEEPANPVKRILLVGGVGALAFGGAGVLLGLLAAGSSGAMLGAAGYLWNDLQQVGADKDPERATKIQVHQVTQYLGFPLAAAGAGAFVVAGGLAVVAMGLLVAQAFL